VGLIRISVENGTENAIEFEAHNAVENGAGSERRKGENITRKEW
jgi:hypothetical protein